jgi:hypothetical protein
MGGFPDGNVFTVLGNFRVYPTEMAARELFSLLLARLKKVDFVLCVTNPS